MDLATVDHLLTTTRSVRKRLDLSRPVPNDVIERCLEIAMQAPTGGNLQQWHFVVVTDSDRRRLIADAYRRVWDVYSKKYADAPAKPQDPTTSGEQMQRVVSSAAYLAEHMHEVPVLIIACLTGRFEKATLDTQAGAYGSILPAAWSLMLALRSRGLGSAWTTLHLVHEQEVARALGIPDGVTQTVLLPVAWYTGDDFKPAARRPARESIHWNSWDNHEAPRT